MSAIVRPTFSESWYRVADLKARLRPSAQISRQFYRGERWYVVRDPAGNQFHRLSAPAYRFIGLLDGTRTVAEAWDLVGGQLADDAPTQNEVIQILSQLHSANLLESNVTPDAAVLLRRHKRMVKQQWQGRLMNILFPRIPLWDPDKFLTRWMPVIRPLVSWFGAIVWLAVVGAAIFALVPEWPKLRAAAGDAIGPDNWPFLWISFCLIKLIHELGHAFACRRFGGEVHEVGIMFLVLVPAPYVDASTAWAFPSKWARMFVGAGGMIIELFVAAIMAFVWINTTPGHLVHQLAYNIMLIASVSTIIFNANPLLRYDGYYILSDYLEIPNLRYRSTEYAMGLIKRHLFKVKLPQPLPPVGQRFWLLLYAIASSIYRTMVGLTIIMMVYNRVPVLGVLMALGGVITWIAVPIFKVSKYLLLEPELHRKRTRAALWVSAAAAAAIVIIGFIPFTVHLEAVGIVEPADKEVIYTRSSGLVDQIKKKDGDWVRGPKRDSNGNIIRDSAGNIIEPGEVIVLCRDRDLESMIAQNQSRLDGAKADLRMNIVLDQNLRRQTESKIVALEHERIELAKRMEDLYVRAPIDGTLIAPELKHMAGKYLRFGSEVGTVARTDVLRVTAVIDQDDAALAYMNIGDKAEIRMASEKWRKDLKGQIEELKGKTTRYPTPLSELPSPVLGTHGGGDAPVDPSDQKGLKLLRPQIGIYVNLDNSNGTYLAGQRAYLRFDLEGKHPLAWQWKRRLWQLIQSHTNSKWT